MLLVSCPDHPGEHDAFAVCRHVTNGRPPAYVDDHAEADLGIIACAECQQRSHEVVCEDMVIVCRAHATERGWIVVAPKRPVN